MPPEFINTLGYYGKVPTHGDFVTRGLPRSFIDPWDLWLQEAILTSRKQLDKDWLNFYLTSPLYHFALSPGICGDSGWMGILMPSVDKVGRYYPMTIGLINNERINPFMALQKKPWFDAMESLALSCLKEGYNLDEFNQGIEQLEKNIGTISADNLSLFERMKQRTFHSAWRQPLSGSESVTELLPWMLDTLLKERCFAYSLWWTEGSELISSSFLFSEGLPPIDSVAAMFDGNWQKWGWENDQRLGLLHEPGSNSNIDA